jgi:hypothetical protein
MDINRDKYGYFTLLFIYPKIFRIIYFIGQKEVYEHQNSTV